MRFQVRERGKVVQDFGVLSKAPFKDILNFYIEVKCPFFNKSFPALGTPNGDSTSTRKARSDRERLTTVKLSTVH